MVHKEGMSEKKKGKRQDLRAEPVKKNKKNNYWAHLAQSFQINSKRRTVEKL